MKNDVSITQSLVTETVLEAVEAVITGGSGGKSSREKRQGGKRCPTNMIYYRFDRQEKKDEKPRISQTNRRTDGPTDRRTDGPMDRWTDGQSLLMRCEDRSKNQ